MIATKTPLLLKTAIALSFASLLIVVLLLPVHSQETQQPIILTDAQGEYPLGLHLELLKDPSGKLTIEQVASPEYGSQFMASQEEIPNFGLTKAAIWVRFRVNNQAETSSPWRLALHDARMGLVELYRPVSDGAGFERRQAGRWLPFAAREVRHPQYVFELELPPQSEQTIYMRFQSRSALALPLTLWSIPSLMQHTQTEMLILGIASGTLLIMLAYSLFLFLLLRDLSYLYLALFTASYILLQASRDGLAHQYLWPAWSSRYSIELAVTLTIIFAVQFSTNFLSVKTQIPRLQYVMNVLLILAAIMFLLVLVTRQTNVWINILALLAMITLITAAFMSWWRGYRPARYYLAGMFLFFIISSIRILAVFDIWQVQVLSEKGPLLSFPFLILFLTLALADRINLLKSETEQANQNLAENEQRLNQLLEAMPVGVSVHDVDTKPKYINQRALQIFNITNPDIRKNLASARTAKESQQEYPLYLANTDQLYPLEQLPLMRALRGEFAAADDIELVRPDKRVPMEVWSTPLFDRHGQVQSVISVFQDITERKQAEAELKRYRHRLEEQVAARTVALTTTNEKLVQEIAERKLTEQELASLLKKQQQTEVALREANLELKQRVRDLAVLNDITQAVATVTNLQAILVLVAEMTTKLFNAFGTGISLFNDVRTERTIVVMHQPIEANNSNLVGQTSSITDDPIYLKYISHGQAVIISDPQHDPLVKSSYQAVMAENLRCLMLVPLQTRGEVIGTIVISADESRPDFTTDELKLAETISGQLAGAVETARSFSAAQQEIEQRRRTQEELAIARDQALEASQFKTRLIAKVSHELRTPLSIILGFSEMLRDGIYGSMSTEQKRVITDVVASGHYLNTLVDELLDQAQLDSGQLKLKISTFAPADLLNQMAISMQIVAHNKGVKLLTHLDSTTPSLIEGDLERIRQIITNLVGNAIKFTDHGQIEVKFYGVDDSYWCFQVSDTGSGIPSEAQNTIFEPFRQVDDTATRRHSGYGLGLSIVKELIDLMGGQINLNSQVGQGTIFTIQLPVQYPEQIKAALPSNLPSTTSNEAI